MNYPLSASDSFVEYPADCEAMCKNSEKTRGKKAFYYSFQNVPRNWARPWECQCFDQCTFGLNPKALLLTTDDTDISGICDRYANYTF